jgi:hypothetical protein
MKNGVHSYHDRLALKKAELFSPSVPYIPGPDRNIKADDQL